MFVHNLRGYDAHLILREAFDVVGKKERISAIPQSTEKFMTFSVGDLKFKDSFRFLASSLETLVEGLKNEDGENKLANFHSMKKGLNTQRHLELICQKGVYPANGWMARKSLNTRGYRPEKPSTRN